MSLKATCAELLESGRFSDITIQCGSSEFKCHKAVVCMQSSVFDAAFNSEFRSTSSVMTLKEDDPVAVARMISFLYTEDYKVEVDPAPDCLTDGTNKRHPLEQHLAVYMVADKYNIEHLKAFSHIRITATLVNTENQPSKDTIPRALSEYIRHLSTEDAMQKEFIEWLIDGRTSYGLKERNEMALELHKDDSFREILRGDGDLALQYMEASVDRLAVAEKKIGVASSVLGEAYKNQSSHKFSIVNYCKNCGGGRAFFYGRNTTSGFPPVNPIDLKFICGACSKETGYAD